MTEIQIFKLKKKTLEAFVQKPKHQDWNEVLSFSFPHAALEIGGLLFLNSADLGSL